MTSWHSYPKIYNLGHAVLKELLADPVIIEEKIDGSQISFGKFGDELKIKSKSAEIRPEHPEKMFKLAVEQIKKRFHLLQEGWTYRGEYLNKPKHNALAYDRVPQGSIILFDITIGEESYLPYLLKKDEANRIDLEIVPIFTIYPHSTENYLLLLEIISCLGGQKIEGFVVKNYHRFGPDKKVLMGKFVSESFKEIHKVSWKSDNPRQNDILFLLNETYRHPARWNKALQHLAEEGKLTDSLKDIGPAMKEIAQDIGKECEQEIKDTLYKWAWPHIHRGVTRGFPEWYKEQLLKKQFEDNSCTL